MSIIYININGILVVICSSLNESYKYYRFCSVIDCNFHAYTSPVARDTNLPTFLRYALEIQSPILPRYTIVCQYVCPKKKKNQCKKYVSLKPPDLSDLRFWPSNYSFFRIIIRLFHSNAAPADCAHRESF